jgi:hypothetical protein
VATGGRSFHIRDRSTVMAMMVVVVPMVVMMPPVMMEMPMVMQCDLLHR